MDRAKMHTYTYTLIFIICLLKNHEFTLISAIPIEHLGVLFTLPLFHTFNPSSCSEKLGFHYFEYIYLFAQSHCMSAMARASQRSVWSSASLLSPWTCFCLLGPWPCSHILGPAAFQPLPSLDHPSCFSEGEGREGREQVDMKRECLLYN